MAIGKSQYSTVNNNWTNNNDIPILMDPTPNNTWSNWGAGQRDLFFLDADGNHATDFNITTWNYDNVYNTILSLLPEDNTCNEIEDTYDSLHYGEYATCEFDNDCISVWGACDVGLGGCHYTVNEDDYLENDINDLVSQWLENDCMEWVCDCSSLPYADCIDATCTPAYCMSDNPVGCFQTGCPTGYECVILEEYCVPSFCDCDGFYGEWFCTEDCGGGTCQIIESTGDINGDGTINVIDVVTLVNIVLDGTWSTSGDINNDGMINVIDVVMLVNIILD